MQMIDEVGYDRITIADLAERADVGRSTFYSHYDSKEDLLFDGFDRWVASIGGGESGPDPEAGRPSTNRFRFALPMLQHIESQRRFFEATMVRSKSSRVRRRSTEIIVHRIRAELERMGRRTDDGTARAVAGAFLEIAAWWLDGGCRLSAEEVAVLFQEAVGANGPD